MWAEENTRESIFEAMLRKEVFATSGPQLRVRLFAGFGLGKEDLAEPDWVARGYAKGVPMGGDLAAAPAGQAPTLLVMASKDPKSAKLDRIQIVKGWIDSAGQQHEKIFDVVWSGERAPDAEGKLPPVDSSVDLATARYENNIGAAELSAAWTDPEFDASQRAFYYARVLEITTPRWSTIDAVKLGKPPLEGIAATIQERAGSAPVWYTPG